MHKRFMSITAAALLSSASALAQVAVPAPTVSQQRPDVPGLNQPTRPNIGQDLRQMLTPEQAAELQRQLDRILQEQRAAQAQQGQQGEEAQGQQATQAQPTWLEPDGPQQRMQAPIVEFPGPVPGRIIGQTPGAERLYGAQGPAGDPGRLDLGTTRNYPLQSPGQATVPGQAATMQEQRIRGTIREVRQVPVRGAAQPATLVLLETQQGNRVVDLGTERLGVQLRPGEQLAVRGRPVSVGDQRVVLQADAIRYAGQTLRTARPAAPQAARRTAPGRNLAMDLGPYDANNDARFSERELTQALYSQFDYDSNGVLTIAEWDRGMDRFFGEGDINLRVSQWDRNGNGRISRTEFRTALGRSGLYDRIDADRSGFVTVGEVDRFAQVGVAQAGIGAAPRAGFEARVAGEEGLFGGDEGLLAEDDGAIAEGYYDEDWELWEDEGWF